MSDTPIIDRQVLLWARQNAGEEMRFLDMRLSNFAHALFGSGGHGQSDACRAWSRAVLDRLVSEGALSTEGKVLGLGEGFDAALAACPPARHEITADDLGDWVGQPFYRRVGRDDALGASPWMRAAYGELMSRQAEGRLTPAAGIEPGRIRMADDWNAFVETGVLSHQLTTLVTRQLRSWTMEFGATELDPADLEAMAEHMNTGIREGFPGNPGIFDPMGPDVEDRRTGDRLTADLGGWEMSFFTCRAEDNFEHKPLDTGHRFPDVVHLEIATGGELFVLSGRGCHETLAQAIHKAHVDDLDLPDAFNADAGAFDHARETFEATGVMSISLGDVFPQPVRDRETGQVMLLSHGDVITRAEADELAAEDNADYENGFYIVENDRYEFLDRGSLEFLTVAMRPHLRELLVTHAGMNGDEANAFLTDQAEDDFGHVYSFPDLPETVHLYIPYGRAVKTFEAAVDGSNLKGTLGGGEAAGLISPEPVTFDERFEVLHIDAVSQEVAPPDEANVEP